MPILVLISIIILWIASSFLFDLNSVFLPDARGVGMLLVSPDFLVSLTYHLAVTFFRVLAGCALATLIGLPLGLVLAANTQLRRAVEPFLDFLRGVPISMLFPLFIVFVGFGELSRSLIVVTLAVPIVTTSVLISALPNADNAERISYFSLRRSLLPERTKFRLAISEALPGIVTGLRLSLSLGLVVVIVTEMFFSASSGIGWLAFRSYERFAIDEMYLLIFIAGIASIGLNIAVSVCESRIN